MGELSQRAEKKDSEVFILQLLVSDILRRDVLPSLRESAVQSVPTLTGKGTVRQMVYRAGAKACSTTANVTVHTGWTALKAEMALVETALKAAVKPLEKIFDTITDKALKVLHDKLDKDATKKKTHAEEKFNLYKRGRDLECMNLARLPAFKAALEALQQGKGETAMKALQAGCKSHFQAHDESFRLSQTFSLDLANHLGNVPGMNVEGLKKKEKRLTDCLAAVVALYIDGLLGALVELAAFLDKDDTNADPVNALREHLFCASARLAAQQEDIVVQARRCLVQASQQRDGAAPASDTASDSVSMYLGMALSEVTDSAGCIHPDACGKFLDALGQLQGFTITALARLHVHVSRAAPTDQQTLRKAVADTAGQVFDELLNTAIPTVVVAWGLTTTLAAEEPLKEVFAPPLVQVCTELVNELPSDLDVVKKNLPVETIVDKILGGVMSAIVKPKLDVGLDAATTKIHALVQRPETLAEAPKHGIHALLQKLHVES